MSSLRQRLNRVVVVLLAGVILQWFVADRTIVYVVESEMESRLRHDADALLASVDVGTSGHLSCDPQAPGTIYATAYSGHYYVIDAGDRRIHSASFGDTPPFDPPAVTTESLDHVVGPREQPLLVLTVRADVDGQPIRLSLGEDLSSLRRDLARFRLRFLALSLLVLVGAIALQGRELRWAWRTLDSIRGAVLQVQRHGTRIPSSDAPSEIRPLADEINRLLATVERRLQQSRTAIGNLSHALKTPLTAMFRLLDDPRLASAPDLKRSLQEQADAIHLRIDRELKRARLAGDASPAAMFDAQAELPTLARLLGQIHRDKSLGIQWTATTTLLPYDRQDLVELIGNLGDNACKWAHAQVRIEICERDGFDIIVSDDGPGCSTENLDALGTRGQRVDESVPGHGFGLAIARDVVEFAGGRLAFARSEALGGLEVTAHLPVPLSAGS
jgi:signal transduction histidine kinase